MIDGTPRVENAAPRTTPGKKTPPISRWALIGFAVAVLSLYGIARTDSTTSRSVIAPGSGASYTAPNGVHVQIMREATIAYAMQKRALDAAPVELAASPLSQSSGAAHRCAGPEQASRHETSQCAIH
jgi:hypothetical protein